jgi:hypothetical protein
MALTHSLACWSRGFAAGSKSPTLVTFDAGGTPPEITDSRLTWHIGTIEDTLPRLELDATCRLFVLFDLDLYERMTRTMSAAFSMSSWILDIGCS